MSKVVQNSTNHISVPNPNIVNSFLAKAYKIHMMLITIRIHVHKLQSCIRFSECLTALLKYVKKTVNQKISENHNQEFSKLRFHKTG